MAGASGVGKTSVSYRLANEAGAGITEVDDFQVVLERMTSPADYPELHLWRRDPDRFRSMTEDEQLAHLVDYAGTVSRPGAGRRQPPGQWTAAGARGGFHPPPARGARLV